MRAHLAAAVVLLGLSLAQALDFDLQTQTKCGE
jgi:hypothetical protein